MKRIIKIISVNIVLCIVIFIIFDYFCLYKHYYKFIIFDYIYQSDRIEQKLPFDKSKASIITVGCSFTFGDEIEVDETFAYKLQKYTMRKTYNLGYSATGVQHILYQLQYSKFFNTKDMIYPPPKYFIYLFISDHMRRMYVNYYTIYETPIKYLRYQKDKNNKLSINHWDRIEPLDYIKITALARIINHFIYGLKSDDELFDFLKLHLVEIKKIIDSKYDNVKFAVIVYNPEVNLDYIMRPTRTERWSELEEEGIQVIRFDKKEYDFLNNEEFKSGLHPNGKAWDVLVPEIIKQLNL